MWIEALSNAFRNLQSSRQTNAATADVIGILETAAVLRIFLFERLCTRKRNAYHTDTFKTEVNCMTK